VDVDPVSDLGAFAARGHNGRLESLWEGGPDGRTGSSSGVTPIRGC
jgi:hypothetical protein